MQATASTALSKRSHQNKVDILVCIVVASLTPFWLSVARFPGGGAIEFGHVASFLLVAVTAANLSAWPRLFNTLKRDWFLAYVFLFTVFLLTGLLHSEFETMSFAFGRIYWVFIMLCLVARQPSARTIYWSSIFAVLTFLICFLYSSNQAGLSVTTLYQEVFLNGNTYYGRNYYLKTLVQHYADPFAPVGTREDSVNIFSHLPVLFTLLLLITRHAVSPFRGKTLLDNLLTLFAVSFCFIALSRTAILILAACVLVSFALSSLKSGSFTGILGLLALGIFLLLVLGTDTSMFEGLRARFFDDNRSLDIRSELTTYTYKVISENPFSGGGRISTELDQRTFHNLYLGAWAASGIIGLIAALAYLTIFSLNWMRALRMALVSRATVNGWSVNWLHSLIVPPILMSFVSGGMGLTGGFSLLAIGLGFQAIDQVRDALKSTAEQADASSDNLPLQDQDKIATRVEA